MVFFLQLFSGYFDTTVGSKTEKDSYTNIVEEMNVKPQEVVFFTDLASGNVLVMSFAQPLMTLAVAVN